MLNMVALLYFTLLRLNKKNCDALHHKGYGLLGLRAALSECLGFFLYWY